MTSQELVRFFQKVIVNSETGCWLWKGATGGKKQHRYGVFTVCGRLVCAHRASYEHFVGPIPKGLVCDHVCEVKLCVNWQHLEPKSQVKNLHASCHTLNYRNSALTHCKNGHELFGDNIRMYKSQRVCRACKREWIRAYRKKNK